MSYIWKAKHFNNYYTLNTPIQGERGCFIKSNGVIISTAKELKNYDNYYNVYLYNKGITNSITINSGGYLYISSGGTANSTTVNNNGKIEVSSGGTANLTTINKEGTLEVSYGGTAKSTTINSYRTSLIISSGGTADSILLNSWGSAYIYSGGIVNNVNIYMGTIEIPSGAVANNFNIYNYYGECIINPHGSLNYCTVSSGGSLSVKSGGTVTNLSINSNAYLNMDITSDTFIDGCDPNGLFHIANGSGNNLTLDSGNITLMSGCIFSNINAKNYCDIYIHAGATINKLFTNYRTTVVGTCNSITNGGMLFVRNEGIASNIITSEGFEVYDGGSVDNVSLVSVFDGEYDHIGAIAVSSGGTATNIIQNSNTFVNIKGGLDNVYIDGSGYLGSFYVKNGSGSNLHFSGYNSVVLNNNNIIDTLKLRILELFKYFFWWNGNKC